MPSLVLYLVIQPHGGSWTLHRAELSAYFYAEVMRPLVMKSLTG